MRKLIAGLILSFAMINVGFAQSTIPTVAAAQPSSSLENISMNFVQTASSASLQPINNRPGNYALILQNTGPYLIYFTNRPNQFRGLIPVEQFIKAWSIGENNLATNPPNGILIAARLNNEPNNANTPLLLTAKSPVYNASKDEMGYVVTPLYSQTLFLQPLQLGRVTLILGS